MSSISRLRHTFVVLTLSLVMAITPTSSVVAISLEQYSQSNIPALFDDRASRASITCEGGALSGNSNLEKTYNFLLGKGLSEIQAAGAVGNISAESGGDPTIAQVGGNVEDPSIFGTEVGVGKAWGLIQWDAGGRAIEYAKRANISGPIHELSTQLDLVWWHMTTETPVGHSNFIDEYENTTDIEEATELYMRKMEAPGVPHFENRVAAAKLALKYTKGETGVVSDCGGAGSSVAGDAVATAVNYAHKQYISPPHTTPTAAYAEAIRKAQQSSPQRYLGGGQYPGIDCNGFTSRIMEDSGVDPDFNTAMRNADGQWKHLRTNPDYEIVDPTKESLQPGDLAYNTGHAYMFVGKVDGFGSEIASASYGGRGGPWRAPMAGNELVGDTNYTWYRLVKSS